MSQDACIYLVEDDRDIGELVRDLLAREGFRVRLLRSAVELDAAVSTDGLPDLLILDVMLPGEDGLSLCRRHRAASRVPILMLTARHDDIDRIIGLELGADDYLGKPFHPRELLARVRALLRRAAPVPVVEASAPRLRFAHYVFDAGARSLCTVHGQPVELQTSDFELLAVLLAHPQRVLSRDQLMDRTRGRSWEAYDRSIDVAVSRLRRRIEPDPAQPTLIKTVRNGGYVLAVPVHRVSD